MAKPKVYVTRVIYGNGIPMLEKECDVTVNREERSLTREELLRNVKGNDAVLCMLSDTIDAPVLDAAGPSCKVFANYAVGYNNVDVPAATQRGIFTTNTPGVLTDATAAITWALLFSVARRIVEGDRMTRAGKFKGWEPQMLLGMDIMGKTLGIIGGGRIGQAFARGGKAFNMKILYTSNKPNLEFENETEARFVDKDTLLRESDFVSLHVPLTPQTRHMIGDREFNLMKPTSILINTARGPVVDEKALVRALKEKRIWGAGLDVYEREPELEPGLPELDNVVIPPHLGSATYETRDKMGIMAAENILAALAGKTPPNCLNPGARK